MSLRSTLGTLLLGKDTAFSQAPPMHPQHMPAPHMQQPAPSIPWMLISDTDVRSSQTNTPLFHITRSAAPGSLSSKSLIKLIRASNGLPMGSIRIRSSTEAIELEINGGMTKMKQDGMGISFRWYFHPNACSGFKWVWSEGDGGLKLSDGSKEGPMLATVNGQTLVCENIGLAEAAVDEIVLSAIAMLAKKKKLGKDSEAAEGIGEVVQALAGA